MNNLIGAKFICSGHVQGVGFRFFVLNRAVSLGLKGYTKNLFDGTVETLAYGNEQQIKALHSYLKQGPERSHVDRCTVSYIDYSKDYKDFRIKH